MVPNGWTQKFLEDIAEFSQGIQVNPDKQFTEYSEGMVRFLRITDFVDQDETPRFIQNPSNRFIVNNTDLSMVRYGSAGAGDLVRGLSGAIANNLFRVIPNELEVTKDYLWVYLSQSKIKHFLFGNSTSSTMPAVSFKLVGKVLVDLPPLPEQQKIAKILSTWDKAIGTTERLIENSSQQKKALMQQLLTGKKRLLDESGKRFEGEWSKGTLANFAKIKKGKALSSKDLKEGSYPVIAGGKSSPYTHSDFTHENIITVSASGAYAGYIAYFDYKIWASDCSVIEPKGDNNIRYLYYWLTNQQQKIYTLQSGGAQPHIYPRDLESLKISIPNSVEQQKIATVLTNADREIELLEQQLADLQQEKKALMQVLLTGKKRVVVDGEVA